MTNGPHGFIDKIRRLVELILTVKKHFFNLLSKSDMK